MEIGIIKPVGIEDQMRSAYLDYAMSVIVQRALPDVRDGLKPVHRRILYHMNDMGLTSNAAFRKSAAIVGEVLGRYHPHGDSAVYDAMVRMAQPWSLRYPLVEGQGNFGSQDDDPAAAMRYTEAKLATISNEMLADIEKNTVNFVDNYDGQHREPSVLPARLPNLLVNGSAGIAVGMATNIPPHNLMEVCDGIIYLIENPEATTEDLMQIIKGPDFPTGGIIKGGEGIRNAFVTGRGRVVIRAKAYTEQSKGGRVSIIVTEIPYLVNKAELHRRIAELARDKRIDGIEAVRDESDRQGIRLVIELRKEAKHIAVLNQLFKFTPMQTAFGVNTLALVDNTPRVLTLKEILKHYIAHREIVITRRSEFELAKAQARQHILNGLMIALDHLDAVIATIRQSTTTEAARNALIAQFNLDQDQARAILELQLGRLASLERKKIEDELAEVLKTIAALEKLLGSITEIRAVIKEDLNEIKTKYGDPRRTEIFDEEAGDFTEEDLIPNQPVFVTMTSNGYIKRISTKAYRAQHRGGKGINGMSTYDDDEVSQLLFANTHDSLLFFTNRGRVYQLKTHELPDVSRQAKGTPLINLIQIDQQELVTAVVVVPNFQASDYLVLVTKKGEVKKTDINDFAAVRRSGLIAMDLEEGDELRWAKLAHNRNDLLLVSANGQAVRFAVQELRSASRISGGVRGMRLDPGTILAGAEIVNSTVEGVELLVVMANGYGKRTALEEYPRHHRGGGGVATAKLTEKTGPIVAAQVIGNTDQDLIIITSGGTIIRQRTHTVSRLGRSTQGVRLITLDKRDTVSAITSATPEIAEEINTMDSDTLERATADRAVLPLGTASGRTGEADGNSGGFESEERHRADGSNGVH